MIDPRSRPDSSESPLSAPEVATSAGPHLAVFGTASDVGKSSVCAAICRLASDAGLRVAPFKAQNMSNNSYVAGDGGEIGRAQYVQAVAARVEPSVHHNPVLLKPSADDDSQVILRGQAVGRTTAQQYFRDNAALREAAYESLRRVAQDVDAVVLEGAGSCAEVNLRAREFVNFPAAHACGARVILVADIDKGGVFAQVVGSLEVMPPEDRKRVVGVVVNKFRGERRLFDDGVQFLEQRTGLPVLGVLPYVYGLDIDAEDAVPLTARVDPPLGSDAERLRIAVVRFPHISNFTDLDALARTDGVAVHYVYRPRDLGQYAAVVLPGSKSVAADLSWLRQTGLADQVLAYHRQGGKLLGICGGFQMLGESLLDPDGVESAESVVAGLGLLRAVTRFQTPKVVRRIRARHLASGQLLGGYEIHAGRTEVRGHEPLLQLLTGEEEHSGVSDGVCDPAARIWATYLHGAFDEPPLRREFLRWLEPEWRERQPLTSRIQQLDEQLDRFAHAVGQHLDWPRIEGWLRCRERLGIE